MIHLTQKFEFETDSIEDFGQMLEIIVPLMFRHQNSESTKLHLKGKPRSYWGDGSEYKWSDMGILEHKGWHSIKPCGTFAGARQYKVHDTVVTKEDAAKEASHCERLAPTRLWIATLSDSPSGFGKDDIACTSRIQMINKAIHSAQYAERTKKEEFEALRVDEWMDGMDGSVHMGFRMAMDYDGGAEVLSLSLCHIYYGK